MNGKLAKKIRKYSRRNWIEYYKEMSEWPFSARLRFAWGLLFGKRGKKKNVK
jgi:hypothetical protein